MFDLDRFLKAQDAGTPSQFDTALTELRTGFKRSHWMWFVLPQLRGLGRSHKALFYGISDIAEARAYAAHPVLGSRLLETISVITTRMEQPSLTLSALMGGTVDSQKTISSLTLFEATGMAEATALLEILDCRCTRTLDMLAANNAAIHDQ